MQHEEGIYKAIAVGCFAQLQLGTDHCPSVPSNLDLCCCDFDLNSDQEGHGLQNGVNY
jgi:hypothetical protein